MKKFILAVATLAALVGCTNRDDNNGNTNETIGTVPVAPNASCLSTAGYNPGQWSPYTNGGFSPFPGYSGYGNAGFGTPYNNGYGPGFNGGFYGNNGICGCPAGTIPVCDANAGLGCAQDPRGYGQNYAYWNWQQSPNNGYGFNYQGYGGMSPYNNNSACFSGVGRTCRVGTADCGYGRCYPSGNSSLGICVQ